MNFLCVDIGTTCSKAQVFDERGEILFYQTRECALAAEDGQPCADAEGIREAVFSLICAATEAGRIDSVAFSSFGEAFLLLDAEDRILSSPMLYTDPRGEKQAREIEERMGRERVFARTGTVPAAMYSVYKYLWLKQHRPLCVQRAEKLLLICDYFGYLLTGKRVIDYGLAARTGVFDVGEKRFDPVLCARFGVDSRLFSEPKPTGSVVGPVRAEAAERLNLPGDCRVILGSHDQICAALGAGVTRAGDCADGMGTVECMTVVFDTPCTDPEFGEKGYPLVPYPGGLYCTYLLNYTSNAIVNWYRRDILHGYDGGRKSQFEYLESCRAPTDLLLLPYFAGAATPYMDVRARGAILNLGTDTADTDIYRAILEGTSFEMKYNLERTAAHGIRVRQVTATGGGANSALWLEIKSDILGLPVRTLRVFEGGLCGCAILQAVAAGAFETFEAAKVAFVRYDAEYLPRETFSDLYREKYRKYKKIYGLLKELERT